MELYIVQLLDFSRSTGFQEMNPPGTLECELRPYQKQALYWMTQLEKGRCIDGASTTLHPCWEAYHLADKYVNLFTFFCF